MFSKYKKRKKDYKQEYKCKSKNCINLYNVIKEKVIKQLYIKKLAYENFKDIKEIRNEII